MLVDLSCCRVAQSEKALTLACIPNQFMDWSSVVPSRPIRPSEVVELVPDLSEKDKVLIHIGHRKSLYAFKSPARHSVEVE